MGKNSGMKNAIRFSASPVQQAVQGRLATGSGRSNKKEVVMLETILIILVVLWALGFFAFHVGSLVHVLLVIALIVLVVRLLQGRRIL
jgi:fatty acid desaturase